MKVSVTNGIENSGAFSKFTLTRSLILFTSGCSLWSLLLFSVLKFLCMELKKVIECISTHFWIQNRTAFLIIHTEHECVDFPVMS